ncbi:MAG: bifunctional precorrin-2 dehydrogenase/sirohydrochlorin ferrochelatase, partial [Desulfobacterales bacterium]
YRTADLEGVFLVICATDDEQLNGLVSRDAQRLNKLCNIADRPDVCNFIIPSVVRRGDLVVAISTSGKSPALAKKLRKELENNFGEEYDDFLHLMGIIRKKLLAHGKQPEYYKPLFEKLVNSELLEMIKNKNIKGVDLLLRRSLGEGFECDNLINQND